MSHFHRLYVPGGTYFFTVVTAQRAPVFKNSKNVQLLRACIAKVREQRPFNIIAAAILPDHLHMIWSLPAGDSDYSIRWSAIKSEFTRRFLLTGGEEQGMTVSQKREKRRGVWQPRFIEHTCRNGKDLAAHMNYIHYNPVKHGLVRRPADWPYSSIHRYIKSKSIKPDWGISYSKEEAPGNQVDANLLE